jgi:hypothetical protein
MRQRHPPDASLTRASVARRAGLALAVGCAVWLLGGCAWLDRQMHGDEGGLRSLSLHYFAEPSTDIGDKARRVVDAAGTQQVCIRRAPLLSNRQIMGGKLETSGDPARPALRLLLDREGSILWLQACQAAPGDSVAVMLDGFFWHAMKLPRPTDTRSILINGPISQAEAQSIVDAIPAHYRRLNPKTGLF